MSKTFAERFKGRIEELKKDGIQKIIASSANPINNSKRAVDQIYQTENIRSKETQRFSKNAQTNILDFQKNYQTMMRPEHQPPPIHQQDQLQMKQFRGVYSALDAPRYNETNQYYPSVVDPTYLHQNVDPGNYYSNHFQGPGKHLINYQV